jgi:hypothetical protein
VREVGRVLSMYVGHNDALVTMDLDFEASTTAAEAATAIFDVERAVRERSPVGDQVAVHRNRRRSVAAPLEPAGLGCRARPICYASR